MGLCTLWCFSFAVLALDLACTALRLSPALRAPPLCRCAVHTKRQGCVSVLLEFDR
jgi:hypothetical protein